MQLATEWCDRNEAVLKSSDLVVLENQIRTPCIVLNAAIYARCFGRARVVHPMTVGAYWKLPTQREPKKAKAVEIVDTVTSGGFPRTYKRDDLADTFLMAAWGMIQVEGAKLSDFL